MINAVVKGQGLKINHPKVVADTIDYLEMTVQFKTEDWNGLVKYVHFTLGDEHYSFELVNDKITKDMHLNLPEGEWEVYIHGCETNGEEVVQRITTEPVVLYVARTGSLDGEPFPELTGSVGEQIMATAKEALRIAEELQEGGAGGGEAGESAYEIAVRHGFEGTEEEWLESLKGKDGVDGKDGKDITPYANNTFANALKGNKSGGAISLADISPVEHTLGVKVRGKNLFDIPNIDSSMSSNIVIIPCEITEPITISAVKDNLVIKNDAGEECSIWRIQATYKDGNAFQITDATEPFTKTFNATRDNPIVKIEYRGTYIREGQYKDIQVEYGTTATAYAPYIPDISAVKVKAQGKNLFNPANWVNAIGEVDINGTRCFNILETQGSYYEIEGDSSTAYTLTIRIYRNSDNTNKTNLKALKPDGTVRNVFSNFELGKEQKTKVYGGEKIYFSGWARNDICIDLTVTQIELGAVGTEYEPYIEPIEYTVNADGTVKGVKSIYPTTLMTDTSGAVIDCEYNRDINKAFAELYNAIISTGGNI